MLYLVHSKVEIKAYVISKNALAEDSMSIGSIWASYRL